MKVDEAKLDGIEVLEILKSSDRSWTDDDISRVGFVDYEVPAEGTEPHLLISSMRGWPTKVAGMPASS